MGQVLVLELSLPVQNHTFVIIYQILTFLNHFDGVHTKPKFPREPNLLKDITKYTYAQIIFLIDEYGLGDGGVEQIDRFRIGRVGKTMYLR